MFYFRKTKDDLPMYAKAVGFTYCKQPMMISLVSLPFALFFMIVGFLDNKEAFTFGGPLLFLTIFMAIVAIRTYFSFKKTIITTFNSQNIDGVIEFSIFRDNDVFVIDNLSIKDRFVFRNSDIANVHYKKNVIVVRLRTGSFYVSKFVSLPNTQELKQLFLYRNSVN